MSTQTSLFISEKQGPWKIDTAPIQEPKENQILIKVEATALNPVDWKMQKGGYFLQNYPAVVGSDAAGVVAKVGSAVTNFKAGDRVIWEGYFLENEKATFQQYSVIEADLAAILPDNVSFEEASTIPMALFTAAVGLYKPYDAPGALDPSAHDGIGLAAPWTAEGKGKYAGEGILILGGGSSVAQLAIQLAKISGFSTIVTTASTKHTDFLKSLGATHVIDRSGDPAANIEAALGGKAKYVYDSISLESTHKLAISVTAEGGSLCTTLPLTAGLDASKIKLANTFGVSIAQQELAVPLFKALPEWLKTGAIKGNRVQLVPNGLKGIPDAFEDMAADKISGVKLVAKPWA